MRSKMSYESKMLNSKYYIKIIYICNDMLFAINIVLIFNICSICST